MSSGRYSIQLNASNYEQYHKDNNLHCCNDQHEGWSGAVSWCHEDEDFALWCGNSEYSSMIKFCPFCGFASKYKEI